MSRAVWGARICSAPAQCGVSPDSKKKCSKHTRKTLLGLLTNFWTLPLAPRLYLKGLPDLAPKGARRRWTWCPR